MPLPKEYIFFCDESLKRGPFFSNFYGGVRVSSNHLNQVNDTLLSCIQKLGIKDEVKWQKVDADRVERYIFVMDAFFGEIEAGRICARIMFTHNMQEPVGLTQEQNDEQYFRLYYQFLKHAFGISDMPEHPEPLRMRIYLDEMGETREKVAKFRGYVRGLSSVLSSNRSGFTIDEQDVTEVRSHDHVLMQCLDVVLGAVCFRLNNMHRVIPEGKRRRGKRTIAKAKLYNHIRKLICRVSKKKYFNIGISTGLGDSNWTSWNAPYTHWKFVPSNHRVNRAFSKP